VLWDKKKKTIVNNESSEITIMLNNEFNDVAKFPDVNLYPTHLKDKMDEVNGWTYNSINNGVYRAGFASQQKAYEEVSVFTFWYLIRLAVLYSMGS
jgi:putative glutathione S-transferase